MSNLGLVGGVSAMLVARVWRLVALDIVKAHIVACAVPEQMGRPV